MYRMYLYAGDLVYGMYYTKRVTLRRRTSREAFKSVITLDSKYRCKKHNNTTKRLYNV